MIRNHLFETRQHHSVAPKVKSAKQANPQNRQHQASAQNKAQHDLKCRWGGGLPEYILVYTAPLFWLHMCHLQRAMVRIRTTHHDHNCPPWLAEPAPFTLQLNHRRFRHPETISGAEVKRSSRNDSFSSNGHRPLDDLYLSNDTSSQLQDRLRLVFISLIPLDSQFS